ncbi:MAG: RES family NAD+ phosphorylase [Terriglobia bacterium]
MKVSAWRMVKRKLAKTAFSGEGARRYGGRWNSPDVAMIYTAESQSLAALEIVVHLEAVELLDEYVVFEVEMDERMIARVEWAQLPRRWRADPPPAGLRALGDSWVASGTSAALQVPSAMVPAEHNFLLNPRHADFSKLRVGRAVRFLFDPRLAKS